jgi:hypothetical protein
MTDLTAVWTLLLTDGIQYDIIRVRQRLYELGIVAHVFVSSPSLFKVVCGI